MTSSDVTTALGYTPVDSNDIVDDLITDDDKKVLSANQGVELKGLIDGLVIPTEAEDIEYDNTESELEAENVQGAIDEVSDTVKAHLADGTQHAKTARFVIGTSTSGWTEKDCDYLCEGTNDQEEIIQALNDLPATGGEIVILDGTYNIGAEILVNKNNVSIIGNGNATKLVRGFNNVPTGGNGVIRITKNNCKIDKLYIDGNKGIYVSSDNSGIYLSSSSSDNTVTGNTCNNSYYGIRLTSSSNNTVTGNTCNNSNYGIYLYSSSSDNTVTGNTCIRGIGTPEDYTTGQHTILLSGTSNNYNLISSNNCMGKAVVISGGTGNSAWGNKFDNTDDLP